MSTFSEYVLLEALRRLGEADSYRKGYEVDKRDDIVRDIHDTEIKDTKDSLESIKIGVVNGIIIFKSVHAQEIRTGEGHTRDYGLTDEKIEEIFKKLFLKPTYNPKKKTMVVYKNDKKKFDLLVISPLESRYIKIITIIQGNKNNSYDYFTPSHKDEQKVIVENCMDVESILILD